MKDIAWSFFELAVNFYQQSIIVVTLTKCLGQKFDEKRQKIYALCTILILFVELSWINNLLPFEGTGVFLPVLILFIYAELCLCGHRIQKIFWSTAIIIIVLGITVVIFTMESSLTGLSYIELVMYKTVERFVGVLIVQIIIFFVLWAIVRTFGKDKQNILDWKKWFLILIVPVISIFTMAFVAESVVSPQKVVRPEQQGYAVSAIVGIMAINMIVCILYQKILKEQEIRLSYEMLKQTINSQEKGVMERKELYLSMRKIKHDLKTQLATIKSMLDEGKCEELKKYLSEYTDETLNQIECTVYTNSDVINHLIFVKYKACLKQGIHMYVVTCNEIPLVSEVDLSILIGNALDNAIEGCSAKTEKEIYLEMRRKENFFFIQIRNKIQDSVLQNNPRLKTSKGDNMMHGLGILSMREVIRKYYGSIAFTEEAGYFCCNILLDI